jgi:lysophospholipase L1-like esterase
MMIRYKKGFKRKMNIIAVCLASLCLCTACTHGIAAPGATDIAGTTPPAVTDPVYDTPQPIPPDVATPPPALSPTPSPTPEVTGPDVPLQPEAEDAFFSDAAFVGNSLMDGFRMFSGLTTCDYYAATSMTVVGISSTAAITLDNGNAGTIMQGLAQKEYGKVYVLLGINEIGFEVSYFKELYGDMLDEIRDIQPDADIYVLSLTPVSAYKSSTSDIFTMTRVNSYNEALYELAGEKDCYYLDICSALSDETGYLPSDVTSDGVHFSAAHYKVWLDYVKTHYVA